MKALTLIVCTLAVVGLSACGTAKPVDGVTSADGVFQNKVAK